MTALVTAVSLMLTHLPAGVSDSHEIMLIPNLHTGSGDDGPPCGYSRPRAIIAGATGALVGDAAAFGVGLLLENRYSTDGTYLRYLFLGALGASVVLAPISATALSALATGNWRHWGDHLLRALWAATLSAIFIVPFVTLLQPVALGFAVAEPAAEDDRTHLARCPDAGRSPDETRETTGQ